MEYLGRSAVITIHSQKADTFVCARIVGVNQVNAFATDMEHLVLEMREMESTRIFLVLYHPNISIHALQLAGVQSWVQCHCRVGSDVVNPLATITSNAWIQQLNTTGDPAPHVTRNAPMQPNTLGSLWTIDRPACARRTQEQQ
jgi:hypothetical protein